MQNKIMIWIKSLIRKEIPHIPGKCDVQKASYGANKECYSVWLIEKINGDVVHFLFVHGVEMTFLFQCHTERE